MTLLFLLAWLALLAACLAALASGLAVVRSRWQPWARRATVAAFVAACLPLVRLAWAFLAGDLSLFYVWQNVDLGYPWWLRLAGLWGGQAGTFTLWACIVLGAASLEGLRERGPSWNRARTILTVLAALLLVPPVLLGLGQATAELGLTGQGTFEHGVAGPSPVNLRPDGQGLNPLLESPYMAIHPPLEFVAYGLTAVVFAYAIPGLAGGHRWAHRAKAWARRAWLAFLVALALGALWAYNVLSFGGYWAWDPVETGDLLPFLALTVFLHAQVVHEREGHLGLTAPAAAAAAFVLVVFATFITRAGLWNSVHAFLPTGLSIGIEDPTARLARIVSEDVPARYTTGLLYAVTGAFTAATSRFHARTLPEGTRSAGLAQAAAWAAALVGLVGLLLPEPVTLIFHELAVLLGLGSGLAGAVVLLALASAPVLLGLVRASEELPLSPRHRAGQLTLASLTLAIVLVATLLLVVLGVNGYDRAVFDARAPFLAAAVLALITLTFWPGDLTRRLIVLAVAAGLAVLTLAVTGSFGWAAVPLCLAAGLGALADLVAKARPLPGLEARGPAGLLVLAGLLGFIHWASPGTVTLAGIGLASPGWYVPVGLSASAATLVSPWLAGKRWPWWTTAVAGLLAVGYGLGALFAVAGWWLGRDDRASPRSTLGSASVPLVHLALAVLVMGVAVSTYEQEVTTFRQAEPLERGVPVQVGPYELELVGGTLIDEDGQGLPEAVGATVHVRKGGAFLSEETLRLEFSRATGFTAAGSYVPDDSQVARGPLEDLILDAEPAVPLSIRVRGTNTTWLTANAAPPPSVSGQVDAVSMGVAQTPGVNLVWAALPVLGLAMAGRMGWLPEPAA